MFKNIDAIISSLLSTKVYKKTRIYSVACLLVVSSSLTLSALGALALYQDHASAETSVNVRKLQKTNLVAKEIKSQNVVEKDGLQFETLIPESVIKIPENKPGARTPIKFGCRITNKTRSSIRVAGFQTLEPEIKTSLSTGSKTDSVGWGGTTNPLELNPAPPYNINLDYPPQKITSKETYPLLMPGESTTFFLRGYLFRSENNLVIQLIDFDFAWILFRFNPNLGMISLEPGEYSFWFEYQNSQKKAGHPRLLIDEGKLPEEEFLVGSVKTPPVKFRLVNAK